MKDDKNQPNTEHEDELLGDDTDYGTLPPIDSFDTPATGRPPIDLEDDETWYRARKVDQRSGRYEINTSSPEKGKRNNTLMAILLFVGVVIIIGASSFVSFLVGQSVVATQQAETIVVTATPKSDIPVGNVVSAETATSTPTTTATMDPLDIARTQIAQTEVAESTLTRVETMGTQSAINLTQMAPIANALAFDDPTPTQEIVVLTWTPVSQASPTATISSGWSIPQATETKSADWGIPAVPVTPTPGWSIPNNG